MTEAIAAVHGFVALGGPVVAILLAMSVLAVALVIVKVWQFRKAGVGDHAAMVKALGHADRGATQQALQQAAAARNHLVPLAILALRVENRDEALRARLTGVAEESIARLQSGFRLLESIAQVAPLLGLFGTVLGMIAAFQALQEAGTNVDPASLAGGIWVALLTTAMGLGIAMPATLVLTWLESRVAGETRLATQIIDVALCRGLMQSTAEAGPSDG